MSKSNDEKKIYAVWVGGVADYFDDEVSAQVYACSWKAEGYDDAQVQVIGVNAMVDYLINKKIMEDNDEQE